MATRSFVQRAHSAGQDAFIWTVNDPAWMFVALTRGVNGLISDKPDLARSDRAPRADERTAALPCSPSFDSAPLRIRSRRRMHCGRNAGCGSN